MNKSTDIALVFLTVVVAVLFMEDLIVCVRELMWLASPSN